MVLEPRAQARLSDDVDEHRPVQRTRRRLLAVDSVLKTIDKRRIGSGGALLRLSGRAPRLKTRSCTVVSQRISARTAGTGQLQSVAVTKCLPQSGHSWQSIQTFPFL